MLLRYRKPILLALLAAVALFAGRTSATAADKDKKKDGYKKPKPTRFIRVLRDKKKVPKQLQTNVVRYVPANGKGKLYVDLVGAVHVGDKKYYQELNKLFEEYDVVLYELVAPKGTRIGKNERKNSTFARVVKNLLELDSQIVEVDYTKKNFVHADMSPSEMAKAMKKRGQTPLTLFMSVFSEMMKQQNKRVAQAKKGGRKIPQIGLGTLLFDPNRSIKLKRYMAEEFDTDDPSMQLGNTLNVVLVADRNKAALKVLDKEIKKGRKKIAIFYGAAHMPDFEKRLMTEFGLKRKSIKWITAWDIKK